MADDRCCHSAPLLRSALAGLLDVRHTREWGPWDAAWAAAEAALDADVPSVQPSDGG